MKYTRYLVALTLLLGCTAAAQEETTRPEDMEKPPEFLLDKESPALSQATIIEADKEASFNAKEKIAVFNGNVRVQDPQFNLTCDKLTVEMDNEQGGLKQAIAEGNVLIVQDKPAENGGKPTRSVGKAKKAIYEVATGDITLLGWPEVRQGINLHRATEFGTRMLLNRDGRLKTFGQSVTLIQDKVEGDGQ